MVEQDTGGGHGQQHLAERLPDPAREALEGGQVDGILFYSPRTAATFAALVRVAQLEPCLAPMTAFCLSGPVAEALNGLPFRDIQVSDEPRQGALLSLIGN